MYFIVDLGTTFVNPGGAGRKWGTRQIPCLAEAGERETTRRLAEREREHHDVTDLQFRIAGQYIYIADEVGHIFHL